MSSANSNLRHIVLITLSAAIGGFLFGFDSSVINGANGASLSVQAFRSASLTLSCGA